MEKILISELYNQVDFLSSSNTGESYFIQENDGGYILENDEGKIIFSWDTDVEVNIPLSDFNIQCLSINGLIYYPYKSELVKFK